MTDSKQTHSNTTNVAPQPETAGKSSVQQAQKPAHKESLLGNLLLNIVIPTLILTKLSGDDWLGTKWAIVVALAFPLIYGLRDLLRSGKVNFFSALGVISILLTGGISLLELDAKYIAIKEAAIPGLLGVATIASLYTRWPLVRTLIYNDRILDTGKIADHLSVNGNETAFERTLQQASWMIAGSFFLSSTLNYILAEVLLQSPPGTEAFNEELGKMTALSFPVIALPATIILMLVLVFLFRRIGKLTGLSLEEIMVQQ
ncbi:VC0807 family protein [Microbulbifer agarilyticus]|uniref:VC0807 family protein n=1 Tax=Microbulbifer agarilyticus TaxID=260552 RepID=UPI001CD77E53|nr:VC0807 family protein [Microbulbifer agarilyticus]MCA0900610.1 MFS transporter [Microbulbifer agarilyticus]